MRLRNGKIYIVRGNVNNVGNINNVNQNIDPSPPLINGGISQSQNNDVPSLKNETKNNVIKTYECQICYTTYPFDEYPGFLCDNCDNKFCKF